jgi:hypothetical protein
LLRDFLWWEEAEERRGVLGKMDCLGGECIVGKISIESQEFRDGDCHWIWREWD